jgi:hypothetical protein
VLHAPLLLASPPRQRYRAARGQAATEQSKERRNRKSEAWAVLAEENHEDREGERQNKSTCNDPDDRRIRIYQSQAVASLSGLEKRVQISVRPLSKTTMRGHFSSLARRRAQLCDEQLPFSIRWATRKGHDSPDGRRQPERRATRDRLSTPLGCRGCLRDAVRGQPDLAPDLLQLEKRQTIDRGERLRRTVFLTDGQVENLPDLVILVPAPVAHVDTTTSGMTGVRPRRSTAPSALYRALKLRSRDSMCDQKRFHMTFPRLPNPERSATACLAGAVIVPAQPDLLKQVGAERTINPATRYCDIQAGSHIGRSASRP